MEILPPGWEDIGAKGLVVLFVLMVFLGWLIPKRWFDRAMSDKDRVIREQAETIKTLTSANTNFAAALQDLTITAHTSQIALRSIAKRADEKGGDES